MVEENTYDEIIFEQIGFDFYGTINSTLPFRRRKGTNSNQYSRQTNPPGTACRQTIC
jgi:hypothetical protein